MHWKRNLFVLSAAQFISMIGMSFFLPFIPLYLAELGVSDPASSARWSGVIFGSGFLGLSLIAPFWGSMADRYGRKLMVVRSMVTGSLILLLTAFVQTPYQLLGLRLLHGCFSGLVSSSIALIATESPEGSMGFGMGVFQSALTAGFIIGPSLGGFLQDYLGIRDTILVGGLILFCGALMVLFFVQEKNKPLTHEARGGPLSNAKLVFGSRTLWPAARIQFLSNFAMMSVQPLMAIFVGTLAQATSPRIGTMSGLVVSASAFSMMLGAPYWGRISDKKGQKKILIICLVGSGLMFIPQGLSQNVTQLFISRLFLGFFAAGIAPSLQSVIAFHSPPEKRAGILGVSFSITLLGNALGPLVGGMLASTMGLRIPFFLVAAILLGTGLLSRRLHLPKTESLLPVISGVD